MHCEACGKQNVEGARFCAQCGALLPITVAPAADPMIGQMVGGRFRVTGILGEGGMGVVYVGEQQMGSTVRKVAIKTLHAHLSKDPSVMARFHRECGTIAELEHPNTIKVYDFGTTADGALYIAMEFVAGKPLSTVIADAALSPARTLRILQQVCGALDEAHEKGIIHRDLKPDNVILTSRAGESDFVKVLDFGIAARSESADAQREQKLTQQGMVLGTPPYMSPEQFTGKALDVRSDVYSLGIMAYEMLTGKLPFKADTAWQWATQHMTEKPAPFEVVAPSTRIPENMRKAIMRALAKNREDRPKSAREFCNELAAGQTPTSVPLVENGGTGTAAMDQVPDFGGAGQKPVPAAIAPTALGPAAPAMPSPVSPAPAIAKSGAKSGGKGGLVMGLGAAGGVLLLVMVVYWIRSNKPQEEVAVTSPFSTSSASGPTTITPIGGGTEATPPGTTTPTPSGATSTNTPPANTVQPPVNTKPSNPTGIKPAAKGGCDACLSAARSGNIVSAASQYKSCDDAGKKAECVNAVKNRAPEAAQAAAFNGNCAQAKAIVAAAQAMGASGAALSGALANTSCK